MNSEVARIKTAFVRQLREAMKTQKVNQAQLAKRLKCSRARITQALDPESNSTTEMLVKLANALDLEVRFEIRPPLLP